VSAWSRLGALAFLALLALPVAAGTVAAGIIAWGALGLRRVAVFGSSMRPTLLPGDHLLVLRRHRPRVGDLVVVRSPSGREVVKRLTAISAAGVEVVGDNLDASTDSRTWGPLPKRALRGRVVYRYAPAQRAGRLPRRRA